MGKLPDYATFMGRFLAEPKMHRRALEDAIKQASQFLVKLEKNEYGIPEIVVESQKIKAQDKLGKYLSLLKNGEFIVTDDDLAYYNIHHQLNLEYHNLTDKDNEQ